jgi:hypothetical protein
MLIMTQVLSYQEIPSPAVKSHMANDTPVELVTVPALGPEWKTEELHAMTKKGRNEDKAYSRQERWKKWSRDQYGCCGGWGTRKVVVWSIFGLCVM